MQIGYLCAMDPGETDRLIRDAVARLERSGLLLAGAVQSNPLRPSGACCDMVLRLLPSGPEHRISADLGPLSRGCRLDPAPLEAAALAVERSLDGADLLVINKFGKQEAAGRGFAPAIAAAVSAGIPVLTGVGRRNLAEFEQFSAGMAQRLPEDVEALLAWALALPGGPAARQIRA